MKVENIERVADLLSKRATLLSVQCVAEEWKHGHFEFAEHCGTNPRRIAITYFPELKKKMLELVREERARIEEELKEL